MDIFFGSDQKIQDTLVSKFESFKVLNEFVFERPSSCLVMLRQARGENLFLENETLEIVFDGYLPGTTGQDLVVKLFSFADKLVNGKIIDYNEYSGLFNICIRSKQNGKVFLKSDPAALLPLYYCLNEDHFYYSSHGHILGLLLDAEPDFSGIMQKVTLGFTLGERYYYKGIKRINPGETVVFDTVSGRVVSEYSNVYYSGYGIEKNIEEELFSGLNLSFERIRKEYSEIGLMLSEGFDSRFLGGIARRNGFKISSYTHGTPGAGGKVIADEVAEALHSDHFFNSMVDGYCHDDNDLTRQIYLSDNLNYPFWMAGAGYFKKLNAGYPVIIGSSLDCILGGNIFYKPAKHIKDAVIQRYNEIMKQDLGLLSEKYIERLSTEIIQESYLKSTGGQSKMIDKTFVPEVANMIKKELKALNEHIASEYDRIKSTGSSLPSLQLQRFVLENRDRKMFFGQPLTIRKDNRIYIPSFEYSFLSRASAVNPAYKLHHKLYLGIYRKYLPDLLRIRNGAYGIRPVYHRTILETSRFILKKKEKNLYTKLLDSKGAMKLSGFRAASVFEVCGRNEGTISRFEELIVKNSDVFTVNGMSRYLKQVKDYEIRVFNHDRLFRGLEVCQVLNKKI
jgi:hypothetical protein